MNYVQRLMCGAMLAGAFGLAAGGCANQGGNVPSGAQSVATGGQDVAFTAPDYGKVYVQDDFDKRVVYSGQVNKGQVVRFDRKQDGVYLDGAVAAQGIPGGWHQHTIYFESMPQPQQAAATIHGDNAARDELKVPVKVQVRHDQPGQTD